ncbi:hypothetical protein GCM10022416_39540 [Actinomadura keratinilytica]|uniref:Mycofactocin n=1 Tax=Actinomadura keratinilytica TaxID=547461 RepID=A0ABP7Z3Q6_9ACTN
MRARTEQGPGEGVELLDGEGLEQFFDLHGAAFLSVGWAARVLHLLGRRAAPVPVVRMEAGHGGRGRRLPDRTGGRGPEAGRAPGAARPNVVSRPFEPVGTGRAGAHLGRHSMQRDIRHAEQARQNDADGAAAIDPDDLAEELLVEEVSIDGMCGVY